MKHIPKTFIMLDAYLKNPRRVKLVKITDQGGVVADDERGVRHYTPTDDRIVIEDLFHPLTIEECT